MKTVPSFRTCKAPPLWPQLPASTIRLPPDFPSKLIERRAPLSGYVIGSFYTGLPAQLKLDASTGDDIYHLADYLGCQSVLEQTREALATQLPVIELLGWTHRHGYDRAMINAAFTRWYYEAVLSHESADAGIANLMGLPKSYLVQLLAQSVSHGIRYQSRLIDQRWRDAFIERARGLEASNQDGAPVLN